LFSAYRRSRDLIAVGAYVRGSDPIVDRAIALYPQLTAYLQQDMHERSSVADARERLHQILGP
jgi:flagellum-specific ATP synthase